MSSMYLNILHTALLSVFMPYTHSSHHLSQINISTLSSIANCAGIFWKLKGFCLSVI